MSDESQPTAPKYLVRLANGAEYGPADMSALIRWVGEGRIPADAMIIGPIGTEVTPRPARDVPELQRYLAAPPFYSSGIRQVDDEEGPAMIPYKNPTALVGYYLGIFSCIPFIGVLLGPTAIVLGILGLRHVKRHPKLKGTAHAIIALTLGIIGTALNGFFVFAAIMASMGP